MTIADFFTLIKEADLGPFDRIHVAVAPSGLIHAKEATEVPEKAETP